MQQGWIGLHRKLMDNAIWSDPNYLKLWIYCLFKASHKEHEQLVGNQMVKLIRGQFVTGRKILADEMNKGVKPDKMLSEKSWTRYLKNLEKWEMLTIKVTNKFSVVTVGNYEVYQGRENKVDHQSDQQLTNSCPTSDQQLTTNNNVNKEKNEKNDIKTLSHKFSISDMGHSKLLFELMQQNNPDVRKPNLDKWADEFRLIRERDNRTDEQIDWLIRWTQRDSFWSSNILSPSKLRKQWDQLALKAKKEHESKKQLQLDNKSVDYERLEAMLEDE